MKKQAFRGGWAQLRRKDFANVCHRGFSIHFSFDHPRRTEAVMGQTPDECLRASSAEGRGHFKAFATQAAP